MQRNSRRTALSIEQTCIYYCMDDGKYSDLEFIGNSHIISKKMKYFWAKLQIVIEGSAVLKYFSSVEVTSWYSLELVVRTWSR